MVTLTTLAESNGWELFSQQTSLWPGASTPTATADTRPRSAARISRLSVAASAGWEDDWQIADEAAAGLPSAPAARAGTAASADPSNTVATPAVKRLIGLIVTDHYHPVAAPVIKPTRWADGGQIMPLPSEG
jgi:hypothetical protein